MMMMMNDNYDTWDFKFSQRRENVGQLLRHYMAQYPRSIVTFMFDTKYIFMSIPVIAQFVFWLALFVTNTSCKQTTEARLVPSFIHFGT
jgi:hypothetical protein